jgi:hypothetical protein
MSTLAEFVYGITAQALAECTPLQRRAYELTRGFHTSGVHTPPMSLSDAAVVMDTTKKNVHIALTYARMHVSEAIAKALILRYSDDDQEIPLVGTATSIDYDDLHSGYTNVGVRSEQRITLGAGSEAMESAGKSTGVRYITETVRAHQTYATRTIR